MTWESLALELLKASMIRPVIVVVAAAVALRILRVSHPASRHKVWTLTMAGVLITPVLAVWMPHFSIPVPVTLEIPSRPMPPVQVQSTEAPAEVGIPSPIPSTFTRESQPLPIKNNERSESLWDLFSKKGSSLFLWLYFVGLLVMAGQRAAGFVLLRRVLSKSRIVRGPVVRESGAVLSPVTAGLLRPVVLLPEKWREWDPWERRAALTHEFAHIRRGDTLSSAFGQLVKCVLWFQPLTWWTAKKTSELSEMACDLEAVEACGDPAAYAQMLLDFSRAVRRSGRRTALPGIAMHSSKAGNSSLSRRVEQILSQPGKHRPLKWRALVLGITAVPILCVASLAGFGAHPVVMSLQQSGPLNLRLPPLPNTAPLPPAAPTNTGQSAVGEAGFLSGKIILSDGSPASNIEVVAMLGPLRNGDITTWSIVTRTRTDNGGQYQLMAPQGSYTITVGWPFATYYPGVTNEARIRDIPLAAGQEVRGLDFAVNRGSGVRVRGRVVSSPGQDVSTMSVGLGTFIDSVVFGSNFHLYHSDLGLMSIRSDGSFEFPVVAPGTYALRIFQDKSAKRTLLLERRLVVERSDVHIEAQVPPTPVLVTGQIFLEGGGRLPIAHAGGDMAPISVSADGPAGYRAGFANDGQVSLALSRGQYRVYLNLPFGYYTKSLSYGTTDLLRSPLDLSQQSSAKISAIVTTTPPEATKNFATVRGRVSGSLANGSLSSGYYPLVAVLQREGPDHFAYYLSPSYRFEIHGVPPGTYRGYVTTPGERYDSGTTIAVGDKDLSDIQLPINPNLGRPH